MSKLVPWSFRTLSCWVSPGASFVAVASALLVLTGWTFDIEVLKRILPGMVSMNPATAIAFMLAGLSLWLLVREQSLKSQRVAQGLALLVLLLGALRLFGYILGTDQGPDQWLFAASLDDEPSPFPNRMAPNAALGFVLLGSGLLLMQRTTSRGRRPAEYCALLIGLVSLLALLGYAYQVTWLYGVESFIPMALHTAAVFHLMAAGLLFARRDQGWASFILSDSPGGALVRHLFPVMLPCLMLLGWLRLEGERRGMFAADMGTTMYTVVAILMVSLLIWWSARILHRADQARLHVEEDLERFFTLSLDMLCIAGKDGSFKRISPAFSTCLGYTTEELLERPFFDLLHPEDRDRTLAEMENLDCGQFPDHFENRLLCQDGTWKWLWWKAQSLPEEGLIYATARDVTEQRKAQEEIRLLNAALNERATQLDASNQELEAFSYSVSHDLRAPLRGIAGFTQALEEHAGRTLDATSQGYLSRVRRAAERMGYLIDDLLKLSRLTRAEMHVEAVNVSHQAESVLAQLRQREPQRQVECDITPDIIVHADAALLRILLENLLENAWKFTSKNPSARIEVGLTSTADDAKVCYVRDNGVGFDMRYASKLFGAFQRLHSMVEFPGTGIGLATVQRVVRRHGGKVWAEAELNKGSSFYFVV
ncbi:ATP-binding protein [Prosthecobacter sp. SYSU 5D2]|uniref:sensor histidine kinase n=1 Tax=Prosthecobacter sp. SYSU 5D2 TaxID=3134134 RepID=UPI0031FE8BEA